MPGCPRWHGGGSPVTADEIRALSRSIAMWHQETPWGVFDYESTF